MLQRVPGVRRSAFLLVLAMSSGLVGQRTYVVDAANGAGADFSALAPAFANVVDGDTVRVRPGRYDPARLETPIRLVFEVGAFVDVVFGPPMEIVGIPAGRICSVQGLTVPIVFAPSGLRVENCAGIVSFDRLDVRAAQPNLAVPEGVLIENSRAVHLANSEILVATQFSESRVSVTDSNFSARQGAAIRVNRSSLELAGCNAVGGTGSQFNPPNALRAVDSDIVIRGDASHEMIGGTAAVSPSQQFDAIAGEGTSILTIDPAVRLSSPPTGLSSLEFRSHPTMSAELGAGGALVAIELRSPPDEAFAILVALPGAPLAVPAIGTLWLHLPTTSQLVSGVQSSSGSFAIQIPRSNQPSSIGLPLAFQAVSVGARVDLSNAATVVVN